MEEKRPTGYFLPLTIGFFQNGNSSGTGRNGVFHIFLPVFGLFISRKILCNSHSRWIHNFLEYVYFERVYMNFYTLSFDRRGHKSFVTKSFYIWLYTRQLSQELTDRIQIWRRAMSFSSGNSSIFITK